LAREMTTILDLVASEPVPTQLVAKLPVGNASTMVGEVLAVVNPGGKVTVIVLFTERDPVDDVVKPTVHVDAVLATSDVGAVPVNVTVDNDDAPALTAFESVMKLRAATAATTAP
jgi:hypothetical protein